MPHKTLAELCAERKAWREQQTPFPDNEAMRRLCAANLRPGVAQRLLRSYYMAERNSRQRKIQFCLSMPELIVIAERANGRCEVTGISFEIVSTSRAWDRQPWTASIDRIDCTRGYIQYNCRLVCASVNVALNSWGESVLDSIVDHVVTKRLRQDEGYIRKLSEESAKIRRKNRRLLKAVV